MSINDHIINMINGPVKVKNPVPFVTGFKNLGMTCYMNSTLHFYSGIIELVTFFIHSAPQDELSASLKEFFTEYYSGCWNYMILERLRKALNSDEPKFNETLPQDSQEYVRYVQNLLFNHFPESPINLTLFNIIDKDGNKEKMKILKIYLPKGTEKGQSYTLDDLIAYNMRDKMIETAPEYIIVNMVLDIDNEKHEIDLSFDPNSISLDKYVVNKENRPIYELKCGMQHFGKFAIDGHDVCYMKLDEGWYLFNDDIASKYTDFVRDHSFGTEYHYLLHRKN